MSKRPPTYKSAMKILWLFKILQDKKTKISKKQILKLLGISEITLSRYIGVINFAFLGCVNQKNEKYWMNKRYK
jgi:hypothetical protein